jgi:hypothetical protein
MNSLPRAALSVPVVRIQTAAHFPDGQLPRLQWLDDGKPEVIVAATPNLFRGIRNNYWYTTGKSIGDGETRIHPDDLKLLEALCPGREWSAYDPDKEAARV